MACGVQCVATDENRHVAPGTMLLSPRPHTANSARGLREDWHSGTGGKFTPNPLYNDLVQACSHTDVFGTPGRGLGQRAATADP